MQDRLQQRQLHTLYRGIESTVISGCQYAKHIAAHSPLCKRMLSGANIDKVVYEIQTWIEYIRVKKSQTVFASSGQIVHKTQRHPAIVKEG